MTRIILRTYMPSCVFLERISVANSWLLELIWYNFYGLWCGVCNLAPVVQNFVSLTLSLSPQFVNYISNSKANTLLFFVEQK